MSTLTWSHSRDLMPLYYRRPKKLSVLPTESGVDERVHIYSLVYGQAIIGFYIMGIGANITMSEVASSANGFANCDYDIYQDTFRT